MITSINSSMHTPIQRPLTSDGTDRAVDPSAKGDGEHGSSISTIDAAKSRVEDKLAFVKSLIDANNRGIGQLVDADLNEESAKLKALQTQEQLAIQSLGIANSTAHQLLRLFQ